MRPTDEETNAIEQVGCYSQFPRGGTTACHARPPCRAPGSIRRQRESRDSVGRSLAVGPWEGRRKAG